MIRQDIIKEMLLNYMKEIKDDSYLTCSRQHYERVIVPIDIDKATEALLQIVMKRLGDSVDMISWMYIGREVDRAFTSYCEGMGLI
jgi:hypothetical protein